MAQLLHGDCLELMKSLDDDSVDLIFCDLPYGQTSCKWDCKIDLQKFWKEVMRIKKLHTPLFFTTTTKFGVELITSAPKKCFFRYDIVWVKSAPTAFLLARKMPLRKHEMVYVFYEKLPFYDLSSHKHKFLNSKNGMKGQDDLCYGKKVKQVQNKKYEPPLPVSIIKETIIKDTKFGTNTYNTEKRKNPIMRKSDQQQYEPALPVSIIREPEPESDLIYTPSFEQKDNADNEYRKMGRKGGESAYDPPLPTTMLEIKSTRGKHSTEKPVALMEWVLKYYSKEGDTILDPTMGSGSTGVACKNMNRNFIGIEMDDEIYEAACNRIYE
jgi:DNA modification methylase